MSLVAAAHYKGAYSGDMALFQLCNIASSASVGAPMHGHDVKLVRTLLP